MRGLGVEGLGFPGLWQGWVLRFSQPVANCVFPVILSSTIERKATTETLPWKDPSPNIGIQTPDAHSLEKHNSQPVANCVFPVILSSTIERKATTETLPWKDPSPNIEMKTPNAHFLGKTQFATGCKLCFPSDFELNYRKTNPKETLSWKDPSPNIEMNTPNAHFLGKTQFATSCELRFSTISYICPPRRSASRPGGRQLPAPCFGTGCCSRLGLLQPLYHF